MRDPLGNPGAVVKLDGLAHQPVVARHARDQALDAGVADVLQLLIIRAIEVGLACAQTRRAPAHFPEFRESPSSLE